MRLIPRGWDGQQVAGRVRTLEMTEGKANERSGIVHPTHDAVYRIRRRVCMATGRS